jgi:hypothetical protein
MNNKNSYIRPKKTHQELLSNEDIKNKLKDYRKIDNISNISIGTHIRYFTVDNKTKNKLFRLGGFLHKIDPSGRFITLNNGNVSWSVQLSSSILYQKMSDDEIKKEIKEQIKNEYLTEVNQKGGNDDTNEFKNQIKILNKKIESLQNIEINYNSLLKEYNSLLKKNESLNNKINKIEEQIIKNKKN